MKTDGLLNLVLGVADAGTLTRALQIANIQLAEAEGQHASASIQADQAYADTIAEFQEYWDSARDTPLSIRHMATSAAAKQLKNRKGKASSEAAYQKVMADHKDELDAADARIRDIQDLATLRQGAIIDPARERLEEAREAAATIKSALDAFSAPPSKSVPTSTNGHKHVDVRADELTDQLVLMATGHA